MGKISENRKEDENYFAQGRITLWTFTCVHGRPQGGDKTGIYPPWKLGLSLENLKSGVYFWLFGLILAIAKLG